MTNSDFNFIAPKEHVMRAGGEDAYNCIGIMNVPITPIHGKENVCYLPETTERSYNALVEKNGAAGYARQVIPNYGHIDCIFGKNAVEDVYPHILPALTE